jgi:hypothetical protein
MFHPPAFFNLERHAPAAEPAYASGDAGALTARGKEITLRGLTKIIAVSCRKIGEEAAVLHPFTVICYFHSNKLPFPATYLTFS